MNEFKLIEDNGLTLHGDIEHFAELIRQEERQVVLDAIDALWGMERDRNDMFSEGTVHPFGPNQGFLALQAQQGIGLQGSRHRTHSGHPPDPLS